MVWIILFVLAVVCGIFGRMGGSDKYDTKWRDVGCNLVGILAIFLFVPFNVALWWVYLVIFGLQWASLSTYWDWLFGFDNMWFSGFIYGVCLFLLVFLGVAWWILLLRAVLLAVIWGLLNIYAIPVFGWNRAQVEEFTRYFFSV